MKMGRLVVLFLFVATCISGKTSSFSQSKALKSITENDLQRHLEFIASEEFRGRETPSAELEICNLYLAQEAEKYGLLPLMPDGSFFQTIPVNVTTVSEARSNLRVITGTGDRNFFFQEDFGGSFRNSGTYSGGVVFAGYGLDAADQGWDDYGTIDCTGKVVIMLDGELPDNHKLKDKAGSRGRNSRSYAPYYKGAAAVLTVISRKRQNDLRSGKNIFYSTPRGRMAVSFESQRSARYSSGQTSQTEEPQRPPLPFGQAEISHETAMEILGVSGNELNRMFGMIESGRQVPGRDIPGKRIELSINTKTHSGYTRSVLALAEGSDPKLKNEYIVICAHQDHLGISRGEIISGADDNGSGTVALLEIAQALTIEKPKRSVILAWFTGEERGYMGSQYFLNNCPVPVENISACLNMDMLCRNDPDSLFLVASDLLSSELDGTIHKMNKKHKIDFGFSYLYSNRTHPQRVYYRSDQYPHIRFGIPSVWFFCGFTPDYHTPRDILEFVDYNKMLKVTKLVYLTAFEIGNMKDLLKLDVNPDVTKRGKHNINVESIR
ncbi:M28 family peptidase [candidate division KSB1 bacterium]